MLWASVIACKLARFTGKFIKDFIDKVVHDPHGPIGGANVWMNLLQNLEYVDLVSLNVPMPLLFLDVW